MKDIRVIKKVNVDRLMICHHPRLCCWVHCYRSTTWILIQCVIQYEKIGTSSVFVLCCSLALPILFPKKSSHKLLFQLKKAAYFQHSSPFFPSWRIWIIFVICSPTSPQNNKVLCIFFLVDIFFKKNYHDIARSGCRGNGN